MTVKNMKTLLKILFFLMTIISGPGLCKTHAAVKRQQTQTDSFFFKLTNNRTPYYATAQSQTRASGGDAPLQKGFTELTLYQLLIAEFALYRNDPGLATGTYTRVARQTRDPKVAEQATKLTILYGSTEQAMEASRLWLKIDPSNPEPRKKLVLLMLKSGTPNETTKRLEIIEHFKAIIKTSSDSGETESSPSQTDSSNDPLSGFDFALSALSAFVGTDLEEQATQMMEQLISHYDKDNVKAQVTLASFFSMTERFQEALEIVRPVTLLTPDDEQTAVFHAQLHLALGNEEQGFEVLSEFVQRHPGDADIARTIHATTLIKQQRYDEAHKAFEEWISKDPENDKAHYSFGLLLLETDQEDQAAEHFKKLVNSPSGELVNLAHLYLGRIAERKGQFHEAIASYRKIRNTQDSQEYWLNTQFKIAGLIAKQTNDLKAAREYLHGITATSEGQFLNIIAFETNLLMDAGLREEALTVYRTAIEKLPHSQSLLYAYTNLAGELGKMDMGVIEPGLHTILSKDPENSEVLNFFGYALTEYTDRYEEAYNLLKRADKLDPESPYITDSLGWVLYKMGHHEEALGYLHQSLSLMSTAETVAHLGEVLWDMGQTEEARRVWSDALQQMTDDESYGYLIRTVERLEGSPEAPVLDSSVWGVD